MLDLAVRGGTIVTADAMRDADVGIAEGRIAELGAVGDARAELDATDLLVLPGVVDAHTHLDAEFRPDGPRTADDFASGTIAAACGGVTTVVDYARQWPGRTLAEGLAEWQARAAGRAVIDYSFHIVVTDFSDRSLADVPAVLADGFPSVKAFMMRITDEELLRLMRAAADAGGLVMAHAENAWVLEHRAQELFAQGKRSARWYVDSRPEIGEAEATSRAIDYAELTGATLCVVHLSCDAALERVRAAKARGGRAWAEVRPCYLLLDAERYAAPGAEPLEYSGCPPLRPAWNLDRLWAGLADRTLDVVGSDHCTWTLEQKSIGADDFTLIPHGIPALETELPSLWTAGVGGGKVAATRLVEALATAPARLHGLYPRKGTIAVGSDADLVLFDPQRRETIAQARLHSRAGYEPCEGMDCTGWPVLTLSRGEVVARDGTFVGTPGRGQLLRRDPPPR
jgi:dihydropyrimidinase